MRFVQSDTLYTEMYERMRGLAAKAFWFRDQVNCLLFPCGIIVHS